MMLRVRFRTVTAVLLALTGGSLLLSRLPPPANAVRLVTPNAEIQITPVPTAGQLARLVPSPLPTSYQPTPFASPTVPTMPAPSLEAPLTIPGPLVDPSLSLLTGPISVPLEIQIPVLKLKAPVLGVGLTSANDMAAPIGMFPEDSLWQTVFWYRGGGIPGDVGTATFAGHFDDVSGRPAVFAYLGELHVGDLIIVRDQRSGLDVPFIVSETERYTDQQAADPAVLARIFGASSVGAAAAQPVSDQLSHLTLITCAGAWVDGSFNLRLVVYAVRASYPVE